MITILMIHKSNHKANTRECKPLYRYIGWTFETKQQYNFFLKDLSKRLETDFDVMYREVK